MKNNKYVYQKKDKGFTLVELIVVLVILAILAAILVPALLGYIDRARTKQDVLDAKNCLTAVQAQMTEQYATKSANATCAINGKTSGSGKDVELQNTTYATQVFETAGITPYVLMVGCGSWKTYSQTDIHKCYTVYFMIYWGEKSSKPIFFDGKKWGTTYPWTEHNVKDGTNTFYGTDLQLYIYSVGDYGNNVNQLWKDLHKFT